MSNFQLSSAKRKEILLKAREDIEYNMYAQAARMGLDLDFFDPTNPGHSWNYTGVDESDLYGKDATNTMSVKGAILNRIIDKLEGPNRVV